MQTAIAVAERRGLMFVLSSPSGAGKTTLSRRLLEAEPALKLSISVTTRHPRPGEREGVDYYFKDKAAYNAMVAAGELLEWAHVFGRDYGTPRAEVMARLEAGQDIVFDIDWQGARQLRERSGEDVVSVFILPPSASALEQRLLNRAQDSVEIVAERMARAAAEIEHWSEYDYVLVNKDLDNTLRRLRTILKAERLKRFRQPGLVALAASLIRDLPHTD